MRKSLKNVTVLAIATGALGLGATSLALAAGTPPVTPGVSNGTSATTAVNTNSSLAKKVVYPKNLGAKTYSYSSGRSKFKLTYHYRPTGMTDKMTFQKHAPFPSTTSYIHSINTKLFRGITTDTASTTAEVGRLSPNAIRHSKTVWTLFGQGAFDGSQKTSTLEYITKIKGGYTEFSVTRTGYVDIQPNVLLLKIAEGITGTV